MEKILVSACLLGEACRYDGKSLDREKCAERLKCLSARFSLVPACPEEAGGLPTPRPRMCFRTLPGESKAKPYGEVIDIHGLERTEALVAGADFCVELARHHGIRKALLKECSPSCGVNYVYRGEEKVKGEGIAAKALRQAGVEVFSEEEEQKLLAGLKKR